MSNQPQRWEKPFNGEPLTDEQLAALEVVPTLARLNPEQFPKNLPLSGLLKHDGRLIRYNKDDAVMLAGDYGHSVFFILEGSVNVIIDSNPPFSKSDEKPQSWWQTFSQLWRNPRGKEVRSDAQLEQANLLLRSRQTGEKQVVISADSPWLSDKTCISLGPGAMVGEMAALLRSPRTASIVATSNLLAFEIRWQGFRDIRKYDLNFKLYIDKVYRERTLKSHLADSELFVHLGADELEEIVSKTIFQSYGGLEWQHKFKHQTTEEDDEYILKKGDYINGLYMLRTGFIKVGVPFGERHRTVDYLNRGQFYGLEEISEHARHQKPLEAKRSLVALGYTDVLIVPTYLIIQHVLPHLTKQQNAGSAGTNKGVEQFKPNSAKEEIFDFLVDKRIINGTSAMMIDMDKCVGCDECVKACSVNHGNNPRFVRQGNSCNNWQVTKACMHCVDPVCLIGCPTGAIARNAQTGNVLINEAACVGCSSCANACPYENIRMVEIYDEQQQLRLDENGNPLMKATKCDLCHQKPGGPACERACPYGALKRIDMRDREMLIKTVNVS